MTDALKNSEIPWIGYIPTSWRTVPIDSEFSEVKIKNHDGSIKNALQFKMGSIIQKTNFDADKEAYVADTIRNYTIVKPGTIVLNGLNLNFDFVSQRVALVKKAGVITSAYITFAPKNTSTVLPEYANYLFKSYDNVKAFHNMGAGVRKILNFNELKHNFFLVPPKEKQLEIVAFLDAECEKIEKIEKIASAEIEAYKNYKQAIITMVVTKGLDAGVEMKDSGIDWVGKVPASWELKPNKYVMHKIKEIQPVYTGEDIISLSMDGVIVRDLDAGGKMPSNFDGYQRIKAGNLLMCLFDMDVTPRCIGLIKQSGVTSPAYSQFEMNKDMSAGYYYYYYLMIDFTKAILHLAKNMRHSFTETELGKIYVPVPPANEQKRIVEFLDNKCSEIDRLISIKQEMINKLDEYKKSLICTYATGKKEVPNG